MISELRQQIAHLQHEREQTFREVRALDGKIAELSREASALAGTRFRAGTPRISKLRQHIVELRRERERAFRRVRALDDKLGQLSREAAAAARTQFHEAHRRERLKIVRNQDHRLED